LIVTGAVSLALYLVVLGLVAVLTVYLGCAADARGRGHQDRLSSGSFQWMG
jgi:hypothetical protein